MYVQNRLPVWVGLPILEERERKQTMVKTIYQEDFDYVLKENIVDFSMSPVEAKKETIKQFEAQGINLDNIIKSLQINEETGRPFITEL
uniref:Uncharacterized protein n=1 Tax=Megaselia scalaris TaxID=36166 RepID=T1GU33_MEGSC